MDKIRKFLICGVIIILLIYSFMTDKGAVRFSVFISGYPKEAITGSLILDKSHKLKSNQKAYIIEPYPVDKATQGVLDRWLVERHAIFYIARFATGA